MLPRSPFIIAEIGEHPAQWKDYIEQASACGADAVKIQLWRPQHFPKEERGVKAKWQFPWHEFEAFVGAAHARGMKAGASVFDFDSCELVSVSGGDFLKLACREEHNLLLRLQAWLVSGLTGPVYRSVNVRKRQTRPAGWLGEIPLACIPEYPALPSTPVFRVWKRPWGYSSHAPRYQDLKRLAEVPDIVERHLGPEPWASTAREFEGMVRFYEK